MVSFCDFCRNCMVFNPQGFNECVFCKYRVPLAGKLTLLDEERREDPAAQFNTYIQRGIKDPAIKRSKTRCPTCGVRYGVTHLGMDEKTILVCECPNSGLVAK